LARSDSVEEGEGTEQSSDEVSGRHIEASSRYE
jgi:hypothetical protein